MKQAADHAVRQAVDLARWRGGRLVAVRLRGTGTAADVDACTHAAMRSLSIADVEVLFEPGDGPLALVSIELDPQSPPPEE